MKDLPASFDGQSIRRVFDDASEIWWFSVIEVVQVLTQQVDCQTARKYWNQLKLRLDKEGNELVTNCHQLKLPAADGKNYLTDVGTAENLLRLVQSIPSPKAEPIKLWLAKVGYEGMQEMADPALSLNRARQTWQQYGRSDKWIAQRMTGQETRNKLTDCWAGLTSGQGKNSPSSPSLPSSPTSSTQTTGEPNRQVGGVGAELPGAWGSEGRAQDFAEESIGRRVGAQELTDRGWSKVDKPPRFGHHKKTASNPNVR